MYEIPILLVVFAVLALWFKQMQAIDNVRAAAKRATTTQGWNFLDDSVVLRRMRLTMVGGRPAVFREFSFEFSDVEAKRHRGSIQHCAGRVLEVKFFFAENIETISR